MSENKSEINLKKLELLKQYNEESNKITQESIETALLMLIEEKKFSSITITEITAKAGVSRNAYYRNYSSKEDILRNVFHRADNLVLDKVSTFLTDDSFNAYLELFQAVLENANIFKIILNADMAGQFSEEMNHRFTDDIPKNNYLERYRKLFWLGALHNVIFQWLKDGMVQTPEEMAAFMKSYPIHPPSP